MLHKRTVAGTIRLGRTEAIDENQDSIIELDGLAIKSIKVDPLVA